MIPAKLFHDVLTMHVINDANKYLAEKGRELLENYDVAKSYEMLTPFVMLAELDREGDIGTHGRHVLVISHASIPYSAGCSYEIEGYKFSISENVLSR